MSYVPDLTNPCAAVQERARARLAAGRPLDDLLAAHPGCVEELTTLLLAQRGLDGPAPAVQAATLTQLQAGWAAACPAATAEAGPVPPDESSLVPRRPGARTESTGGAA